MRSILAGLVVLVAVFAAHSAAPTYATTNGVYEWKKDTTIDSDGAFDTLAATDSTTIVSGWTPDNAWEYILVRDPITGTGSDSVKVQVRMDCYDGSNLIYSVYPDSFTAAAGEAVFLPIAGTAFGTKFTIKGVGYTDNGGQVILNRLAIWKRRPTTVSKKWD